MASNTTITTPLALSCTKSATLTSPWFVQSTEYYPAQATFKPLVNGEEAFGTIYDAIMAAQHSVDIICWGFQPSMYFKRNDGGGSVCIGQLLAQKGADGVRVRLLCWADSLHVAAWGENNMPGNNFQTMAKPYMPDWLLSLIPSGQRDYQKEFEREFDREWYRRANLNNVTLRSDGASERARGGNDAFQGVEFATRDFSLLNRAEIAYRTALHGKDSQRSTGTKAENSITMGITEPTHHQKMVLIDYEMPERALGFVMGHNMLDTYWDRNDHGYMRMHPSMGRNGLHPREDISSRVSGPILKYLNENFCQAWDDATGQSLGQSRAAVACQLTLRRGFDTPVMAQILRTQSQHKKRDIEAMYLQAVNNTANFIYIENQYFRFAPLADKIVAAAKAQLAAGRDPGKYGPLHLFVVTNSSDEGMGDGTVNTYRMMNSLGRDDTMPAVTREERDDTLSNQLSSAQQQETTANMSALNASSTQEESTAQQAQAAAKTKEAALRQQISDNKSGNAPIMPADIPGLKVHICTLVAPDSPPGKWDYVYVHAKLMVVDDVFMTLGSANINTRSMEGDSELNICHEHSGVTQPLRNQLWDIHTKGKRIGAYDSNGRFDSGAAFVQWSFVIKRNARNQDKKLSPYASLVGFMRDSPSRTYKD